MVSARLTQDLKRGAVPTAWLPWKPLKQSSALYREKPIRVLSILQCISLRVPDVPFSLQNNQFSAPRRWDGRCPQEGPRQGGNTCTTRASALEELCSHQQRSHRHKQSSAGRQPQPAHTRRSAEHRAPLQSSPVIPHPRQGPSRICTFLTVQKQKKRLKAI